VMSRARAIRIALMLMLIFAAGAFCGWWMGRSARADEPASPTRPAPRNTAAMKERLLNELTSDLRLTPEQHERISKLLEDWAKDNQRLLQQNMRERLVMFDKYAPLIRTNLTAEQQKIYDTKTQQAQRRRERIIQRQ
jgi:hypothetical protein